MAKAPLMPLRIYASRTLSAANVVVLLVGGATFGMWFFVSLYLQQVLGYSPIKAGLSFLPMTLCIVAGSTLASRAVIRVGAKPLLIAGMVAMTVGLLLFTQISVHGGYLSDVLAPSLLVAIGIGLAFVPATISPSPASGPRRPGWPRGWSTPRGWWAGRSGWRFSPRWPPPGPRTTCSITRSPSPPR